MNLPQIFKFISLGNYSYYTRAPCREYRLDNNNIDQLELFSLFA